MALGSVGPYRVLEHLGAGANGEVSLAEDTRLHRRVALKTLSGTAAVDGSELRRRLLREARAAARLNHPNIAAVYDVLESDEGVHIVMEYVRGTTLATRIRQGPPTPMQVVDIALQLSSALVHAHSLGVIHRDLKPANIVIAPDGSTKILDFGLARLCEVDAGSVPLSASSELSGDVRHVVGTPPYIPPEHLSGEVVNERGDIYSLGVTLFELLTGRRPFEASNGMGLTQAILSAPTPRVRSSCPECPAGLDAIVYRAMSRNPSARYASAADLSADLKRLSAGITDVPTQSRTWPMADARNRPRLLWTAAAIVAAVMASLGLAGRDRWSSAATPSFAVTPLPRVVAVLPLAGAAGDPHREAFAAGAAEILIARLSKVPGVSVVPRAATLNHRDRTTDRDVIAREMGATMLLDGVVDFSAGKPTIALTVQRTGEPPLWRRRIDGTYDALIGLEDEIAAVVATEFALPGAGDGKRLTDSGDAFAAYAQARSLLERFDVGTNLEQSISLFQTAIAADPNFARAHAGLGEANWRKYQATREDSLSVEADIASARAVDIDPKDPAVRIARASIYRGMKRMTDAVTELEYAVAEEPGSDDVHRQLGTLLASMGEHARGVAELKAAVALRPGYWINHASLGTAYYNQGHYPLAADAFKRITELQPDNPSGYSMLGSALHAMDDTARAVHLYEKAFALGSATAAGNLGMLHLQLGGYEDATRHLTEAVRRDPKSPLLSLNLADAYAQMGREADAHAGYLRTVELSEEQLRRNPNDARIVARLAIAESKLGRARDAARHINEAAIREPTNADINFYLAVIRVRAGRFDEALEALDIAFKRGYSRRRAGRDPDLAPLRKHGGFQALIATPHGGTS